MRKTAHNAAAVMTAVAVALAVVMIVVVLLHAVMALAALVRVQPVVVADSARVVRVAPRVVMAMTAVVLRVVLVIVTAMARRSVSGWRFQRMCRSRSSLKTRRWTHSPRTCVRRGMRSACLMPHVWCWPVATVSWCASVAQRSVPRVSIMCLRTAACSSRVMKLLRMCCAALPWMSFTVWRRSNSKHPRASLPPWPSVA